MVGQPDLPVVSINNVQRMGGLSSASMEWVVSDGDGEANSDGLVFIDGVQVDVTHSCLSSVEGVYQCVTLVPLAATTNDSYTVELKVADAELNRTVVASYTLPAGLEADEENEVALGEDSGSSVGDVGLLLGVLVLAVLVGLGALMRSGSKPDDAPDVSVADDADGGESEGASSGGGLLARAERLR